MTTDTATCDERETYQQQNARERKLASRRDYWQSRANGGNRYMNARAAWYVDYLDDLQAIPF